MMKSKTIFFVDDDPDDQFFMKKMFTEYWKDTRFETFKTPLTLIEYLKNPRIPVPDLILTELYMPIMDGIELAKLLRNKERFRKTPIILFSGPVSPSKLKEAFDAGISHYLTKPVDNLEFIDLMKYMNCWYNCYYKALQKPLRLSLSNL